MVSGVLEMFVNGMHNWFEKNRFEKILCTFFLYCYTLRLFLNSNNIFLVSVPSSYHNMSKMFTFFFFFKKEKDKS